MQNLLARLIIICAAGAASVGMGQGYSPGQTFTSSGQRPAAATPVQQAPQQQQRVAPALVPTATPRLQRARDAAPLYNISSTPKARPPASSRASSNKATPTPRARKESARKAEPAKAAPTEVPAKKVPVVVTKTPEPAVVATPEVAAATKSETTVVPGGPVPLVINNLKSGKKMVALTYDDGPNPNLTPELVAYLRANDVPATFFVCGNMVRSKPAMVKELSDAGFELANHTYDHPNLNKLSREKILDQLQDTHDAVKEAAGVDMKLMRPPFGAFNSNVRQVCEDMGYKIIMWDVDTEDWRGRSTSQMVNTIMKGSKDGSIILMHDRLHRGKPTVMETTKAAVEQLRAKGYTFVTVGDLIAEREGKAKAETATAAGPAHVPLPTPAPIASGTSATLAVPVAPGQVVDILPSNP